MYSTNDLPDNMSSKVKVDPDTGCWEWQAAKNNVGYGLTTYQHKFQTAHRASWQNFYGPIPPGEHHGTSCVCHTCDNPACINPDHLFLATHKENMNDRDQKGRCPWVNGEFPERVAGEKHPTAKLTTQDINYIRFIASLKCVSQQYLADRFGVDDSHISRIIRRKVWKHV